MIIQSLSQINSLSRPKYLIISEILSQNIKHTLDGIIRQFGDNIIAIVLRATYIVAAIPIRFFFRINSTVPKELRSLSKDSRYIIVANHKSRIDPCLILATLSFKTIFALSPIRFFTANQYLQHWWQRCLLGSLGSFRAYSTENKISGTRGGLHFSDKGQSLLIFPQGKRVHGSLKGELKVGVAYMAKQRNFTILPVYISGIKEQPGRKTHIRWGKPFVLDSEALSKDLPELTNHIFEDVIALSRK